tara:strand:- start:20 stop:181 length:162 start_codon:yes stop_codon:yes gene_type:complete
VAVIDRWQTVVEHGGLFTQHEQHLAVLSGHLPEVATAGEQDSDESFKNHEQPR